MAVQVVARVGKEDVKSSTSKTKSGSVNSSLRFHEKMLAGAGARGVAQTILHPVDVMRTRIQAKGVTSKLQLKTFLKGVIPQITLAVPAGAIQFVAFEFVKESLAKMDPEDKFGTARQLIAGALGATAAAVVRVPQEVVKQRIQADIYPNVSVAVKEIMLTSGPAGFYKGALATISRDVPWNALSFVFHGELKKTFSAINSRAPTDQENLVLASVSGMIAAVIMTPIDVVKTRIMTQRVGEVAKYSGIIGTISGIAKDEGFKALFKGVLPRVMYLAPLAGITLSIYEAIAASILKSRSIQKSSKLVLNPLSRKKAAVCKYLTA
eukprot:CAMPEP_0182448902 /NCGR_PEP_ID=MMETSP1172-20130603/30552_1 /TAXON_ID=708627 /ORGANISM="Timspurckia oligopyrenoides, Strain CCMP3278" /LENGTH=322 /DNA_ID=CAMNT_0024645945 /DNA_START=33 /DNA_END=1001 /DNA_ORIENTATION=+